MWKISFLGIILTGVLSRTAQAAFIFSDENPSYYYKYIFMFGAIISFGIIRHVIVNYDFPVPYSILLILLGFMWGVGGWYVEWMQKMINFIPMLLTNLHMVYIPILVFNIAFCLDVNVFFKSLPQILIISLPVSLFTATILGLVMKLILNNNWTLLHALIFGTLACPIYPMEVVRWLKETNIQTKYITTLLEGETTISAYVGIHTCFLLLFYYDGIVIHSYQFVMSLVRVVVIGLPTSYLMGLFGVNMMKLTYNDTVSLMMLSFAMCFFGGFIIDVMAFPSATLGRMIYGIMMNMERASLSKKTDKTLGYFWETLNSIINGLMFIIIGAVIPSVVADGAIFLKDYILIFVTYLVSNIARFIGFFMFSPILMRVGYGMSFQNMIIWVWGGMKNIICVSGALMLRIGWVTHTDRNIAEMFVFHHLFLCILYLLFNGSFFPILLRALGLTDISISRQINMNNCMKYIYESRSRAIAILKMDRFLSDANWPLVMQATALKHPYKKTNISHDIEVDEDEDFFFGYKFTFCPDCEKNIPNEPTAKEMKEMTKEAKLRVLKMKKTIYSRQFENGMVSKEGIRILHQYVEVAVDTQELVIHLESLYRLFSQEGICYRCIRNYIHNLLTTKDEGYKPPRKRWKLWCYRLVNNNYFDLFITVLFLLHILQITLYLGLLRQSNLAGQLAINTSVCFLVSYILIFWLKVLARSWIYIWKHGIHYYFSSYWNSMEFVIFCITCVSLIVDFITWTIPTSKKTLYVHILLCIILIVRICKLFVYLKYCIFFKTLPHLFLKFLNEKVNKHKAQAVELGKAFIAGEEEILENLDQIIDNDKIREIIKNKIQKDRLAVTKKLGLAQKDAADVVTTVKTKAAMRTVLNSMKDDVYELKVSGWVDDVEYNKLLKSISAKYKYINSIKYIQPSAPQLIFREVPYMGDKDDVLEFLFANITTKKFDPGDVVFADGEMVDGIYILITGMFIVSYSPKEDVLMKLKEFGALPIIDYSVLPTYDENFFEYIVPGNTIGELAIVTDRPYSGHIVAETHSQVFVLKREIIKKAFMLDTDPVNGLECRIWKYIGFRKSLSVLKTVPTYRSYTQNQINYILERSFVPNLSNYKIFVVNEMMEDIILLEGLVVDYHTRDTFTGPCHIPRVVQKLLLPKSSYINMDEAVETKLLIIPAKDFDEYEIMVNEEQTCELVDKESSKCLHHLIQSRASTMAKSPKVSSHKNKGLLNVKTFKDKIIVGGSNKSKITFATGGGMSKSSMGLSMHSKQSRMMR